MKVAIIPEKCIACGLCQTYSGVFDYNDDGIVIFTGNCLDHETASALQPISPDTHIFRHKHQHFSCRKNFHAGAQADRLTPISVQSYTGADRSL